MRRCRRPGTKWYSRSNWSWRTGGSFEGPTIANILDVLVLFHGGGKRLRGNHHGNVAERWASHLARVRAHLGEQCQRLQSAHAICPVSSQQYRHVVKIVKEAAIFLSKVAGIAVFLNDDFDDMVQYIVEQAGNFTKQAVSDKYKAWKDWAD
eukprot:1237393-Pyramimonas_sp.AAC.1